MSSFIWWRKTILNKSISPNKILKSSSAFNILPYKTTKDRKNKGFEKKSNNSYEAKKLFNTAYWICQQKPKLKGKCPNLQKISPSLWFQELKGLQLYFKFNENNN